MSPSSTCSPRPSLRLRRTRWRSSSMGWTAAWNRAWSAGGASFAERRAAIWDRLHRPRWGAEAHILACRASARRQDGSASLRWILSAPDEATIHLRFRIGGGMEHNHFEHCLQGWPTLLGLLAVASLGSAGFIALLGGGVASRDPAAICNARCTAGSRDHRGGDDQPGGRWRKPGGRCLAEAARVASLGNRQRTGAGDPVGARRAARSR